MSYTCSLTGIPIEHGELALLSFIIPSIRNDSNDGYVVVNDPYAEKAIDRKTYIDDSLYYSFVDYTPTRISFDVKNFSVDFQLIESKENIKNLENLVRLLCNDYYIELSDYFIFVDDEEKNKHEFKESKIRFSSEYLSELFGDKKYMECFSYIIHHIDYAYILNHKKPIKLSYNLISSKSIEHIISEEFTTKYYGFSYKNLYKIISELDTEYEVDSMWFVDDTILNQFENVIPMFEYDMDINSPEDFKLVYHKYCLSAYIDLIFKDTRTKLSPSYSKENLDLIDTFNFKLELINGIAEVIS